MKRLLAIFLLAASPAIAQQGAPLPLTDWRAEVDGDLAKVPMTREAQITIMAMMQAYERRARTQKATADALQRHPLPGAETEPPKAPE